MNSRHSSAAKASGKAPERNLNPTSVEKTQRLGPDEVEAAARLLRAGGLVALPTETVYGLAGDATSGAAVAAIYAAKGRPSFNPLIVHVPDLAAARAIARFTPQAEALAQAFWPGPLTLVLPLRADAGVASLVTAGLETVAIRVPAHPLAQAVLRAAGRPLAAPSANPSGRISPVTAEHVLGGLDGRIAAVIDGGRCGVGLESTIVGWPDGRATLLRPGGLAAEEITPLTGPLARHAEGGSPTAPGQLSSHYAPNAPLRLNATQARPGEVLIGFGLVAGEMSLSESGDLHEAAANLFDLLRRADDLDRPIAVAPVPATGLGLAINDRLTRAAAPR